MNEQLLLAALPIVGGWVVWVSKKVTSHEAVIQRIDQLVTLLLEDRLDAQDKERRQAQESYHRRSYR